MKTVKQTEKRHAGKRETQTRQERAAKAKLAAKQVVRFSESTEPRSSKDWIRQIDLCGIKREADMEFEARTTTDERVEETLFYHPGESEFYLKRVTPLPDDQEQVNFRRLSARQAVEWAVEPRGAFIEGMGRNADAAKAKAKAKKGGAR